MAMKTLLDFDDFDLVESPLLGEYIPKMKLSQNCPVTDGFRAEMDAWLLDFFGQEQHALINEQSRTIFAHPNVIRRLKMAYSLGNPYLAAAL